MKTLLKIAVIVVIGAGLLGLAGTLMLPSAARVGVEKGAGSALGVGASLADVSAGLGPSKTTFGLEGLALDNPEGFGEQPLLDIGEAAVEVGTFSLLSDTIEVPSIVLDGLQLHLVQNGMESNLGQVLQHVRERAQDPDPTVPRETSEAAESGGDGSGKRIAFGTVSVAGVGAKLDLAGIPGIADRSYEWTAPAFEMDLSDEANRARVDSIEKLAEELIQQIAQRSMASNAELPAPVVAVLQGTSSLEDAGDALIDGAKDKLKETVGKELGGALDGLFGGDR